MDYKIILERAEKNKKIVPKKDIVFDEIKISKLGFKFYILYLILSKAIKGRLLKK